MRREKGMVVLRRAMLVRSPHRVTVEGVIDTTNVLLPAIVEGEIDIVSVPQPATVEAVRDILSTELQSMTGMNVAEEGLWPVDLWTRI